MTDHIRSLSAMASTRISCYPNAGLPNEEGKYLETPASLAEQLERFTKNGWLNMVGGCCGTTEKHIAAIAQMVEGRAPRTVRPPSHQRILFRHRAGRSRGQQPSPHRRRAHQRNRLARLQKSDRCREVGRGRRNRAPSGPQRRAHHRRLSAEHRPRRAHRYPASSTKNCIRHRSGARHDRYHRSARHRTFAHLLPGQEHHQLSQP